MCSLYRYIVFTISSLEVLYMIMCVLRVMMKMIMRVILEPHL